MNQTHELPLKFVFHSVGNDERSWYFDLTDIDRDDCVGLYDWDNAAGCHLDERYSGWKIPEIIRFVDEGDWIIDFEVSDAKCPEVDDLL